MSMSDEKLKLYEIMVTSQNNNENKRLATNGFYFTILSALLVFTQLNDKIEFNLIYGLIIIICILWIIHIYIYKKLSQAKFEVICDLEKEAEYQIFTKEYEHFNKRKFKVAKLTELEKYIPILFMLLAILKILKLF